MVREAEEVLWVTCPRCGNEWAPDARLWKNLNNVIRTGRKAVYCPACNKRVVLSQDDTLYLLKQRRSKKVKTRKARKRLKKHGKKRSGEL